MTDTQTGLEFRPFTGTGRFHVSSDTRYGEKLVITTTVAELNCCEFCECEVSDQTLRSWEHCCVEFGLNLRIMQLENAIEAVMAMEPTYDERDVTIREICQSTMGD